MSCGQVSFLCVMGAVLRRAGWTANLRIRSPSSALPLLPVPSLAVLFLADPLRA